LHLTTRQDIQIHHVSLDRTPELWAELEQDQITLREACGNTVRNVTASALAGIDPNEPFDVTPYADAFFRYFLRNPVCQEMGRKFKVAFSSGREDTALTFMHDLGFIPRVREEQGRVVRGFRVLIGGGLGAQPQVAQPAVEFLPADRIIPFAESLLRVFDHHGERARRNKARFKYLLRDWGLEKVLAAAAEERLALPHRSIPIPEEAEPVNLPDIAPAPVAVKDARKFRNWKATNLYAQKQPGYFAVALKVSTGDFSAAVARQLAAVVRQFAADDIRATVNQGMMLRYIPTASLPAVFNALDAIGLAEPGFDSVLDITACPGTDTCNLGITSSTGITRALQAVL
ncbi:MAG: nitrite/sulfite reductase, partial [Bacteroidota bacterium]